MPGNFDNFKFTLLMWSYKTRNILLIYIIKIIQYQKYLNYSEIFIRNKNESIDKIINIL